MAAGVAAGAGVAAREAGVISPLASSLTSAPWRVGNRCEHSAFIALVGSSYDDLMRSLTLGLTTLNASSVSPSLASKSILRQRCR